MADDRLPNNQLKHVISRLSDNFDLTGEDIADILWLALKQKQSLDEAENNPDLRDDIEPSQEKPNIIEKKNNPDNPLTELNPAPRKEEPSVNIHPTKTDEDKSASSLSGKTLPFRHPDPPSIPKQLEFAKAFRPLMRKVDSGRRTKLDELETVKRTAEEGIFIPILKSEPEPWLDLALVVDENSSMVIWSNTVKELKQLFEHYGIFREVRIWGLTKDEEGKIQIRAKIGKQGRFKNPQELIDPTHRRLILIVSDCVAQMWFDGTILSTLQGWTKHQPMAIIQMLPDWMWLRTGLRMGASVELVNLMPEAVNRNLRIHELLLWKDIDLEQGTKIPVFTLNPEIASLWSGFVAGIRDKVMAGFVLPSESEFTRPPQSLQTQVSQLKAEQRVDRFRKISSPLGRKLAGLLMAAPVITLPVVRLIQKTLLPESLPVHIAEVFLGGLLKPLTEITADTEPDRVWFDVIDDKIRNILLDDAPYSDSQFILETISDYIEKNIGKSLKECVALLKIKKASPGEDGEQENLERAYAQISLKILKQLGGNYAQFAEELETVSPIKEREHPTPVNDPPRYQEFTFEVATISIEDDRSFTSVQQPKNSESQKQRIALISIEGDPASNNIGTGETAGQDIYVRNVGEALGQLGWQVDMFTRKVSAKQETIVQHSENCRTIRLQAGPLEFVPQDNLFEYLPEFIDNFLKFQTENGFTYSLVHTNYWLSSWVGMQLKKIQGSKQVHTYHSLGAVEYNTIEDIPLIASQRLTVEKEVLETAERIVATSPQEKEHMRELVSLKGNIDIIPCGTDIRQFGSIDRQTARAEFGIALEAKVVLYVGRFDQRKGIETLVRAIAESKLKGNENLQLIIGGGSTPGNNDGRERDRIESIVKELGISDITTFPGRLSQEILPTYYAAADVCVVPSHYEPFGLVAIEAMACSTPVVASDVGGLQYTVVPEETGLLAPPQDVPAFAAAIDRILLNPEWAQELGRNGRKRVESKFSWDGVATQLSELYTQILQRKIVINRTQKTAQYYVEDLGNDILLEMVAIPEGSFLMGSPEDEPERREDESPQHEVTIHPFYMGKYPVTQAQWQAVAALPQVNRELDADPSRFKGKNLPVERVSWYDAVEFCDRLSRQTGKPYRLPSEAEWEYACRAGTTTPFHFGETITTDLANYRGTDNEEYKWSGSYGLGPKGIYREETTEVGSFGAANAFGLYDVHGNIWEWCADHWHDNYEEAPTDGSVRFNDNDNRLRLLRGGSWDINPANCRSASRGNDLAAYDDNHFGFRVVCGLSPRILSP